MVVEPKSSLFFCFAMTIVLWLWLICAYSFTIHRTCHILIKSQGQKLSLHCSKQAFSQHSEMWRRGFRLFLMVGSSAILLCSWYLAVFVTVFHIFFSLPYLHFLCGWACVWWWWVGGRCIHVYDVIWMCVCPLSSTTIGHWQRSSTAHRDLWFPIGGGFWWLGVRA